MSAIIQIQNFMQKFGPIKREKTPRKHHINSAKEKGKMDKKVKKKDQ